MPVPYSPYSSWASCGLGSTVTLQDVKEVAPGVKIISSTSMTLAAVEKDKVVVDMVVRNQIDGGSGPSHPTEILQEVEIPASLLEPGSPSEGDPGSKENGSRGGSELSFAPDPRSPEGALRGEGDELLTIGGTEVPCHWAEYAVDLGGSWMVVRTWTSDRIPGGLARSRVRVEGGSVQESTTEVVSFLRK